MKKKFALFCFFMFCVLLLSGCGEKNYKQLSFFIEPGSYKNSSISLKCKVPKEENGYSFHYDFYQSLTRKENGVFHDATIISSSESARTRAFILVFDVSFSNGTNTNGHPWFYDLTGSPLSIPEDITANTFVEEFLPTFFLVESSSHSAALINNDKVKDHYSWDDTYNSKDIFAYPYPCYMTTEVWQTKLADKTYSCKEIYSYKLWSIMDVGCADLYNYKYDLQRAYMRRQGDYMVCILVDSDCATIEDGRESIDVLMSYFSKA